MDIVSIKAPEGSSLGTVKNQARASMEASITQEWGGTQGPKDSLRGYVALPQFV
jgi:hypothetical protein